MSICNRVVNITSAGAAIISDNPTETATGTLKVHRCSSAGNTCLTISHANSTKYSYVQLQNDDNSHQYHLGIGNTAVPNAAVRGKFYLFANASSKSLLEIDSSGRAKFQTSVGSGGANASATWHTETSGLQLVGPCACTLSRFMITAVDPSSSPNACAVYSQLTMGHWDNSRVLLESTGKQLMITSYDEGIALGNDGNAELCIGTLGDVIIKPTTAKNVDPYGTLCLDITGSTNPQYGGLVMNSTTQTHIRFLSSGNLCWQWRHWNPTTEDKFSAYSWKRGCDMFNIQGSNAYFGSYGHITSCAPIYIANSLDPYFINTGGNKCMNFYYFAWPGCSCFGQTHLMARFDSSLTNVCQVYPTATLYNANETEGTSSTLAFAGKETGGGNSVGLAYISGRKEGSTTGSWGKGSLNFLVNCAGVQCWTMCMTMHGGVCVIKCLVAPSIQMANSNCILCLAATGSGGPYIQGSADCTISYWGIDSSWKAQINSDGGFCAANCVVAPVFCANSTTVPLSLVHSGVATYNWCFIDTNNLSFHPNTTSTKTLYFCNAGTGVMNVCADGCFKSPIVCGTTCLSGSFLLIGCNAAGLGCGVTACFSRINDTGPDGHRLAIVVDPAANVVLYCSTGTSLGGHCFYNCAFSPYIYATCFCGTECVKSPVICATTTMQVGGNNVLTTASQVGANFCAGTDVNNRVVTANGDSGSLCGEANMTFDGSTLNVTGAITASGDITSTSDERVKREIAAICGAIQIVNNLCGRIFIKDNRQQVGVIAQEVEKVLPQVVFEHSDNDLKSVSYGNIVGVLIEAIKDQNKRIDNQQEEIDCLKEIIKSK